MNNTLINGVSTQHICAYDRGFTYGQSLFTTAVVQNGEVLLLEQHLTRLKDGCAALNLLCDFAQLEQEIASLIASQERCIVRITLSMGQGGRGYQNPKQPSPTRVVSLHDCPPYSPALQDDGVTLGTVQIKLGHQPALAGLKHGNRWEQIIARSQWQDDWHEALLFDSHDNVIEATQSNVFIVNGQTLSTPDLSQAGVTGVMRNTILTAAKELGLNTQIVRLSEADIIAAQAVFLCNSVIGIWPVAQYQNASITHYNNFNVAHQLRHYLINNAAIPTL